MTPEEISQELTALHEYTLEQLHGVIGVHREYLRGLILEAQEEVRNWAASPCDASPAEGQEGAPKVAPAANAVDLAFKAGKRRAGAAPEESAAAERPNKRRGRPPKQPKQPVIAEEDEEIGTKCQQPAGPDSQQQSGSATIVAAGTEAEGSAEAADEASSAATGTEQRPARGRSAVVADGTAIAATTRSTRSRRAAPAPKAAAARRGTRSRHGAATTAPLDAIAEDDEVVQELEQTQQQSNTAAAAADTAAPPVELPSSALNAPTGGAEEQQQMHDMCQAEQTVTKTFSTDAVKGSLDCDDEQQLAAAAVEEEVGLSKQHQEAEAPLAGKCAHDRQQGGSPEPQMQQPALLSLQRPADATPPAVGGPPKTPGFSLAPRSVQKAESDTPCFVGHGPRSSTPQQQLQRTSPEEVPAGSPAAALVRREISAETSTAGGRGCQQAVAPGSADQQAAARPKAPSLSFGQPLHAPLTGDTHQKDTEGVSGAVADEPLVAAPAGLAATAAQGGAPCSMDWKSFLSTMHAGDAPTPTVSRQRLRSHSGADVPQQQHQKQQQPSGGLRQTTPAAASNATTAASDGQVAADAGTAMPASSRHVTASSMKQLRSPSLQTLQVDDSELAADGERVDRAISFTPASSRKSRDVRSPRPSLPRSAKRSTGVMAGAAAKADTAGEGELQQEDAAEQQESVDGLQEAAGIFQQQEEAAVLCDEHKEAAGAEADEEAHAQDEGIAQQSPAGEEAAAQQQDEDVYSKMQQEQEVADAAPEVTEIVADPADVAANSSDVSTDVPVATKPVVPAAAAGGSKAADPVSAWLAATATASAGAAGDKAKQQLEAAKDSKAAAAGARPNLVSGIRSFVPTAAKKEAPPIAAGKVKVKVKALEAAEAARKAEDAKAQERAAKQQSKEQQQQQCKARGAAETGAASKPQGTPSGAVAQCKVAAVERAAAGLSGSGGAVRVLAKQPEEEGHKPADKDAVQKKADKDAEAAKRAMDKAEREDRMKRAEQKRKDEEQKRRQELADRQRLKEERAAAAAAALRGGKAVVGKAAGGTQASRAAADKVAEKGKHNATAASDPSSFKTPAAPKAVPRVDTAAAIAPGDTAAANGDSPSLTIKLLEPVSTGNKPKGAMGPPAPVGGKTPAAFKTPAPHVSEQEKRNVEALKSSPYINTGTKRTPYSQQQQQPDPDSYMISPYRDDDVDTPDRSHKPIPDWARSHKLFEALQTQQHTDPDTIFGERQSTCDLAYMFADVTPQQQQPQQRHRIRKLGQRTSSADWSQDRLTWQEEVKYKKDMGYL